MFQKTENQLRELDREAQKEKNRQLEINKSRAREQLLKMQLLISPRTPPKR